MHHKLDKSNAGFERKTKRYRDDYKVYGWRNRNNEIGINGHREILLCDICVLFCFLTCNFQDVHYL